VQPHLDLEVECESAAPPPRVAFALVRAISTPIPLTWRFLTAEQMEVQVEGTAAGTASRVAGRGVWAALLYAHRMVLSPRAGYRIAKKTGRAVNRTIKQTKTAISILLPQCLATDRGFRRRGS
jgi:hypothetical protein